MNSKLHDLLLVGRRAALVSRDLHATDDAFVLDRFTDSNPHFVQILDGLAVVMKVRNGHGDNNCHTNNRNNFGGH